MDTRDSIPTRPPVTEKLVARLWDEQGPFALPLATTDGEEIQVVYRGWRRWDRGPDFAGALIALPGARLCHGDVEVHVRSSDWRAHGHHRDPNYGRVILQIVLWDDAAEPALRVDGAPVPVVALAPRLLATLDALLAAPLPEVLPSSPCRRETPEDLARLGELLDRCGMERFATHAARMESDLTCAPPDQILYRAMADALGYSRNREPMGRLAELVPLELLIACQTGGRGDTETRGRGDTETGRQGDGGTGGWGSARAQHPALVESLLLGAAGLLPSQRGIPGGEEDPYVRGLEACWAAEGTSWVGTSMRAGEWEFFRARPANFPTRRVAALAGLVARWPRDGLADTLESLARVVEPRALPRALESLLLGGNPDGYWAHHCDFGLRVRRPTGLVGRQRAAEVAVNAFLPFLTARTFSMGDEELGHRVREVYRLYPKRGDNELSRHVAAQLTGLPRPRVARSACRQQGLLHLYRIWCEAKRCGECPCGGGCRVR